MTAQETPIEESPALISSGYRITVDEGRESFYALSMEEPENETAWIMSDTVYSLEAMR